MGYSFWIMSNKEYARLSVLSMLEGYLKAQKEHGLTPSPDELLEYIEQHTKEETERLRKSFPEKE